MSELVTDCPRCAARRTTFDIRAQAFRRVAYDWQHTYEIFGVCRHCDRSTIFVVTQREVNDHWAPHEQYHLVQFDGSLNSEFDVSGFINVSHNANREAPDHLPKAISNAFAEGAACMSIKCFNAAACMFRLCVDLATRPLLPSPDDKNRTQPNDRQRRDLGLRLPWLFQQGLLPNDLHDLATCIKEDGNDGAHVGSISKEDAEDMIDFTEALLERLITEPARVAAKKKAQAARKEQRKQGK